MAFTKFTIEGEAIFGYFSDQPFEEDRHVRIKDDNESTGDAPVAVGVSQQVGKRVEQMIAQSFGFPNDAEFDALNQRMDELRGKGLRPAEGVPDIVRTGTSLKITVEVVEDK